MELQVKGDNIGALTAVLKLRAKDPMLNAIAREIALDIREGRYEVTLLQHIPGISNVLPDALSRQYSPDPKPFPESLRGARHREVPSRGTDFWRTWANPAR